MRYLLPKDPAVPLLLVPAPRSCDDATGPVAEPVYLADRRARAQAALRVAAQAPVRHVSPALLEALHGSWGTAEEVLGRTAPARRLTVAR